MHLKEMRLSKIKSTNPHAILHIEESELKYRLYELGIYPDQTLQLINKAPFGDPLVVQVDGHLVMLRLNEAELITVQEN